MNHVEYIVPAYALTVAGLVGLLVVSWLRMRAAERAADVVRSRSREPRS
ncbi:heme exporter protein CcmD [Sphingosinicellaceae bacterium]|nr:heme exporter protein CcmD [Sphingosinicellaceae bacterium]